MHFFCSISVCVYTTSCTHQRCRCCFWERSSGETCVTSTPKWSKMHFCCVLHKRFSVIHKKKDEKKFIQRDTCLSLWSRREERKTENIDTPNCSQITNTFIISTGRLERPEKNTIKWLILKKKKKIFPNQDISAFFSYMQYNKSDT